jgi:glycosyltransferase involved in cell wall biosynthesis
MPGIAPVAVVIPAHNAAATLASALRSVLAQTLTPAEIIVVDDASTDATVAVASSYAGVKLITLPDHRGAAAARNQGISAATSHWIAFLDADDVWLPQKLERQFACLRDAPQASLVFCASLEFAPDGRLLGDTFRGGSVSTGNEAWKPLLKTNFVATPTVLAPRALLLELGGFDESLTVGEDQDMWIRLALAGSLAYVPEPLVRVHVRPQSLSAFNPTDQSRFLLPMIERHVRELRGSLTAGERRDILGERLSNAGRMSFAHGDIVHGAAFMLRAVLLGYRPLASMFTLAKAPLAFARRALQPPRGQTAA